jgi:hypothetical protein
MERPVVPSSLGRVCASVIHLSRCAPDHFRQVHESVFVQQEVSRQGAPRSRKKVIFQHYFHLGLAPTQAKSPICMRKRPPKSFKIAVGFVLLIVTEHNFEEKWRMARARCIVFFLLVWVRVEFYLPARRFLFIYYNIFIYPIFVGSAGIKIYIEYRCKINDYLTFTASLGAMPR